MMNIEDKAKYEPPNLMKPSKMTTSFEYIPDSPHEIKALPKLPKTPIFGRSSRSSSPFSEAHTTPKEERTGTKKSVVIEPVSDREKQLIQRAEDLQADLVLALGATEDIAAMKE